MRNEINKKLWSLLNGGYGISFAFGSLLVFDRNLILHKYFSFIFICHNSNAVGSSSSSHLFLLKTAHKSVQGLLTSLKKMKVLCQVRPNFFFFFTPSQRKERGETNIHFLSFEQAHAQCVLRRSGPLYKRSFLRIFHQNCFEIVFID